MKRVGFLGLVLSLFVFSCTGKEDNNKRVFIAGHIINPSSRTVTLYEGNCVFKNIMTLCPMVFLNSNTCRNINLYY